MQSNQGNLTKQDATAVVNVVHALTSDARFSMRTNAALLRAAGGNEAVVDTVLEAFSHDVLRRSSDGETLYRLR